LILFKGRKDTSGCHFPIELKGSQGGRGRQVVIKVTEDELNY
jgi:hypothetical protein